MTDSLVTPNGKEIAVKPATNINGYQIYFTSGGELPSILTGIFTSQTDAIKAINSYLTTKIKDESSNGTRKVKQGV